MRVLIIGCGYIGLPLGAKLVQQGHQVTGFGRTIETRDPVGAVGIVPVNVDITRRETFPTLTEPFDWVINCVSSSHGGPKDYESVYLGGTRNLIDWLTPQPPAKFLYTSSTGVYGQDDGSEVDESAATEPTTVTGKILVQTEKQLLEAHARDQFPAIILRVAGIYGPGRKYQLRRLLSGDARIESGGKRHLNMIHRDDVVGSIIAALEKGLPGNIYNAVDDEPVSQLDFLKWLSRQLHLALPPEASPEEMTGKKRGITDKRLSNRRLHEELDYSLIHPTFREGYAAEIAALNRR